MNRTATLLTLCLLLHLSLSAQLGGLPSLGQGGTLLPSPVVHFSAVRSGPSVELRWRALPVPGLSHFEVERSSDGKNFAPLGRLAATSAEHYTFTDGQAGHFLTYYRVQAVSDSGHHQAGASLMVKGGNKNLFEIFPNPARETLQVQVFGKGTFTLLLLDGQGVQLRRQEAVSPNNLLSLSLDLGGLQPGTYYLSVNGETQRFLKQ